MASDVEQLLEYFYTIWAVSPATSDEAGRTQFLVFGGVMVYTGRKSSKDVA